MCREPISFEQAREIAIHHIGADNGLIDNLTIVKPYGWYFMYQSKAWRQSRDFRCMLLGNGGFVVPRGGGTIYEFGSVFPTERNLAAYEFGLRYEPMDLTVTHVRNQGKTADHLVEILNYVQPTWAQVRDGKIPVNYTRDQIIDSLQTLPCMFRNCKGSFFKCESFFSMARSRCCKFGLCVSRDGSDAAPS